MTLNVNTIGEGRVYELFMKSGDPHTLMAMHHMHQNSDHDATRKRLYSDLVTTIERFNYDLRLIEMEFERSAVEGEPITAIQLKIPIEQPESEHDTETDTDSDESNTSTVASSCYCTD